MSGMDAVTQLGTAVILSTTAEESADFCDKCCRVFRVSFGCIISIIAVLVSAADIVTDWKNFLTIHNSDFRWSDYAKQNDYEPMLWALCGACVVGSLSTLVEAIIVLIRLCLFFDIIGRDRRHSAERVARRELVITYIGELAFHVELFCQDIVVIILYIFATFRHLCPYFMASGVISIGITLLSSCIRILKIIVLVVLAKHLQSRRRKSRKTRSPRSLGTIDEVSEKGHITKTRSVTGSVSSMDKLCRGSMDNLDCKSSTDSKPSLVSLDLKSSHRPQKSVSFDSHLDHSSDYSYRPAKYDIYYDDRDDIFLGETYKADNTGCCGLSRLRSCQMFVYVPLLIFLIVILLLALYYFPQQQAHCEQLSGVKMKPVQSSNNFIQNLLFN